jgi:hypothetical protein
MLRFAILGPVEVRAGEVRLRVGGPREQKVLVALLLNPERAVPVERLAAVLWGAEAPPTARAQVHNSIAAVEFACLVRQADELVERGAYPAPAGRLGAALELWRGPALGGLGGTILQAEARRLEERRLSCLERRIEVDLAMGRNRDVVGELAGLVAEFPLRERLVELHMLALYRAAAGVGCSISTDDPAMFDTTLSAEYGLAHRLGLTARDAYTAGLAGALCDPATRARLAAVGRAGVRARSTAQPDRTRSAPAEPAGGSAAEMVLQRVEPAVPVTGQRGQKLLRHLHRRGAQAVPYPAPLALFGRHQAGLGQQGQVLGDRLPRDRQPIGQVRGRGRAARRQRGQDAAPGRVGQGDEDLFGDRLDVRPCVGRRVRRH